MSGYYNIDALPQVYAHQQSQSRTWANVALAATGVVGMALVWIGASGLAAEQQQVTYLRTTSLDLGASQGTSGIQSGVEVDETGERAYYSAVSGKSPVGKWRAGVSRKGDGPVSQTIDLSHKEGNTAFKLGLKKSADAAWKWAAGTSTEGVWNGGSAGGDATGAGGDPLVLTADLGTSDGDLKWTAGVKSTDGDLNVRAGVAGGGKSNSWALGVDTGSIDKPGNWKVAVNAGN